MKMLNRKSILLFFLTLLFNCFYSKGQSIKIEPSEVTAEYHYVRAVSDGCYNVGIELGELPLPIIWKKIILEKKKKVVKLSGIIHLGEEGKISTQISFGEDIDDRICTNKLLCKVNKYTGNFSIAFKINSKTDVVLFNEIGYEVLVLKVGRLL